MGMREQIAVPSICKNHLHAKLILLKSAHVPKIGESVEHFLLFIHLHSLFIIPSRHSLILLQTSHSPYHKFGPSFPPNTQYVETDGAMAPQVVEAVASSAAKEFKKESATARLLGSGTPSQSSLIRND